MDLKMILILMGVSQKWEYILVLGVLRIRTIVFWGLYWDPPI